MTCSLTRESLSAWADGEDAPATPLEVSRHLATCTDCATYADRLGGLTELTRALRTVDAPPGGATTVSPAVPGAPSRQMRRLLWLRLGVVLLALTQVAAAAVELLADHGYGGQDHAGHESLSFTLAVCAGLLWVAWRPAYARGYLVLTGLAGGLLALTATLDVLNGNAKLLDELPHAGFVLAFGLLWAMCHPGGGPARAGTRSSARPTAPRRLRVVRGSLRAAAVLLVPGVVLVAAPSWSHATLESSTPGDGAVVKTLPSSVTLHFDESVSTLPTSLEVYGPDGSRIDNGDVTHPGGVGAEVSVGTTGSQRGTYLVSWRVISADSHPVSGAFTFSVGKRTAAPTAPTQHTDPTVGALLGASRWLGYAGSALSLGGLVFLMVCWSQGWESERPLVVVVVGLGAMTLGAVVSLLLKGPYDAALGLSAVGRRSLLHEVLSSTYGHADLARLAAVVVMGGVLLVGAGRPRTWRLGLLTVAGLVVLASFAASGHAVSDNPRWIAVPVDMLHVAGMSVWLGGLVMMACFVLRGAVPDEPAGAVARRFSAVALTAVSVLVLTGTYQAWRQVRSWAALFATTYGRELLVKLALVALVLVVAAASRRWVRGRSTDLSVLRRRVSVEAVGIVAILGVTSALVATEPAKTAYHPSVSANLTLGPDLVQVSAIPDGDRRMELHLYVFDKQERPTEPKQVTASVSLPSQQIGPLDVPLEKVGKGHRTAVVAVPVAGNWTLSVLVRTSAIDEYTKTVTLPIR